MKLNRLKYRLLRIFLIAGLLVVFKIFLPTLSRAQTCCSGGVPMAGNVGSMTPEERGTFQLAFGLDWNYLRTLKEGRVTIDDQSRLRTTYSGLLNFSYSITDRFSAEGLISFVRQERNIRQGDFNDFTSTTGPGDMVFLFYFTYFSNSGMALRAGLGPKLPTGPSDLRNREGIRLNADLQPGSGALDVFFNHMFIRTLEIRPSSTITHTVTYRVIGENSGYLGSQRYSFGNELHMSLGITDQNLIGKSLLNYGVNIRYRHAARDIINGHHLPNTGGQWIFVMPNISWNISPRSSFNASAELPLLSNISGTQLTPTFRIHVGAHLKIEKRRDLLPGF